MNSPPLMIVMNLMSHDCAAAFVGRLSQCPWSSQTEDTPRVRRVSKVHWIADVEFD